MKEKRGFPLLFNELCDTSEPMFVNEIRVLGLHSEIGTESQRRRSRWLVKRLAASASEKSTARAPP